MVYKGLTADKRLGDSCISAQRMESIKQQLHEKTIRCCLIDKGRVWSSKEGFGVAGR